MLRHIPACRLFECRTLPDADDVLQLQVRAQEVAADMQEDSIIDDLLQQVTCSLFAQPVAESSHRQQEVCHRQI